MRMRKNTAKRRTKTKRRARIPTPLPPPPPPQPLPEPFAIERMTMRVHDYAADRVAVEFTGTLPYDTAAKILEILRPFSDRLAAWQRDNISSRGDGFVWGPRP